MLIALDYSMSCPAMCLTDKPGLTDNTTLWYLTDVRKKEGIWFGGLIHGEGHDEWLTPEQRYDQISGYFINILIKKAVPNTTPVYIEDYSMGSKGKVFHIAENTGLAKWKLWKQGHPIHLIAPTVIKKFATGKGNAKKPDMYNAFKSTTGLDLSTLGKPDGSPVSDICDAYWLAQLGLKMEGVT